MLEDLERIAKELHDGVIQALFAVGLGLQGSTMLARDPELQRRIGGAVEELDRVIADLRNYIFGLRPGILADRQLDQALRRLVRNWSTRPAWSRSWSTLRRPPPWPRSCSWPARACPMPAATPKATTCRVSLYEEGATVVLEVDDDGRGFDPANVRPGGQGLGNLQERALAIGGRVELDSHPSEGTRVRVELPRPSPLGC